MSDPADELSELRQELEIERRRADICDVAAISAIARADRERQEIIDECQRRADGIRALMDSNRYPEAEGAALALELLADWIKHHGKRTHRKG